VNPTRHRFAATRGARLTADDLQDKPRFGDIADELLDFVQGAELLIHNAEFDVRVPQRGARARRAPAPGKRLHRADTLAMARDMHPARRTRSTRSASATRWTISKRTLHGALLDAQLLADVWLAMTRGQETLDIALGRGRSAAHGVVSPARALRASSCVQARPRSSPRMPRCASASSAKARAGAWMRIRSA
jgi:DNA polymerase-3 subunit epsilon